MLLKLLQHLIMHFCSSVKHGYYEAFDCKVRVWSGLYESDGLQELSKTFNDLERVWEEYNVYEKQDETK